MPKDRPDICVPKKDPKPIAIVNPINIAIKAIFTTQFARDNDSLSKGTTIGFATAFLMYGPDRVAYIKRACSVEPTIRDIMVKAKENKLRGLGTSMLKQATQLTFTFAISEPIEDILNNLEHEKEVNEKIAKGFGAGFGKLLLYPASTIEGLRYLGQPWGKILERPLGSFYSGSLASACSHTIAFPILLLTTEQLKPYVGATFAGGLGSVVAATLASPFGVTSDVQKKNPHRNMVETAKTLYAQGGALRFFRGLPAQLVPATAFGVGFGYLYSTINDTIQERNEKDAEANRCIKP